MDFTKEQARILKQTSGSFRVLAAAGSGKTSTMSYLVKDEIVSKRTAEHEICFITFTRFAADQIKNKMRSIMERWTSVLYGTFNATMWKLLYKAGIEPPEPKGLYDARMEQGVLFFIDLMIKRDPRLVRILQAYKILIVDEFQDLDENQFNFVKEFKNIQPNLRIIAIGDLAQNIYRFRGTSNEFLRTRLIDLIPDLKSFELTTNFRSSKHILDFVNILFSHEIKEGHILPMRAPDFAKEGCKPKYYEYAKNPGKGFGEYEENVALTLLPILKDAKKNGKSVVLIFPVIKCPSFQIITALLRSYSRNEGYSFDLHQIAKEDETCLTVTFNYDPKDPNSPVQCSSFHASKGLEWDIVAIINMSDIMFQLRDTDEDSEAFYAEKTNLAYVGVTRAAEELHIFADANKGGRCRLFARLGTEIDSVMNTTYWGADDQSEYETGRLKPIGVVELIRKFQQNPDLYERAIHCSQSIKVLSQNRGQNMALEYIYNEMKVRNRELAFGTFIDWKLKQLICVGKSKTLQDIIVELFNLVGLYLSKNTAYENIKQRLMKIDIYFLNSDKEPNEELIRYITASRYIALFSGRMWSMVPGVKTVWKEVEKRITAVASKEKREMKDEYILSQANNFYLKNVITEIQAIDAPPHLKQGLPDNFEEFVNSVLEPGALAIKACAGSVGIPVNTPISGDVGLESDCFILGEADMVMDDMILEIKCGTHTNPVDLREAGSCKNLLQILSYVSLGRHGTLPLKCNKAAIINPLTGSWEAYDIESWPIENSLEFMSVLKELRARV
jgi:superfamily I DNA/RNA helicase